MNNNRLKTYLLDFISVIVISLNIMIYGVFLITGKDAVTTSYKSTFGVARIFLLLFALLLLMYIIASLIVNLAVIKRKKNVVNFTFIYTFCVSILWLIVNILMMVSLHIINSNRADYNKYELLLKMSKLYNFSYYMQFVMAYLLIVSVSFLLFRVCFHKEKLENNINNLEKEVDNLQNIDYIADELLKVENVGEVNESGNLDKK